MIVLKRGVTLPLDLKGTANRVHGYGCIRWHVHFARVPGAFARDFVLNV